MLIFKNFLLKKYECEKSKDFIVEMIGICLIRVFFFEKNE